MKRFWLISFVMTIILPTLAFAHKPLLMVDDNGDGTIYIETGFSDGSSGAGNTVLLKDASTGKVLVEKKIPEESSLDMKKPSVPYIVVFNAGEGHIVEKEGPALSSSDSEASASEESDSDSAEEEVSTPAPAPAAPAAPVYQAAPAGPGMSAAIEMMVGTQIFASVGIFFIFGALMFVLGQRMERRKK